MVSFFGNRSWSSRRSCKSQAEKEKERKDTEYFEKQRQKLLANPKLGEGWGYW